MIQSLSGHTSADMILRYSMPSEEDKQKAVEHIFKDESLQGDEQIQRCIDLLMEIRNKSK